MLIVRLPVRPVRRFSRSSASPSNPTLATKTPENASLAPSGTPRWLSPAGFACSRYCLIDATLTGCRLSERSWVRVKLHGFDPEHPVKRPDGSLWTATMEARP